MTAQNSQYLTSKVLTATPQRLHLMLVEGAIRFGRQAEKLLTAGDATAASAPLLRAIDIMGELLANVRQQNDEINKRLTELYWFLFRRFSEAKIHSDAGKLAEALKLLEFERETWLLVCEQTAQTPAPPVAKSKQAGPPAKNSTTKSASPTNPGGFSFQA